MSKPDPSGDLFAVVDRLDRGESISWNELTSWMQRGDIELEALAFAILTPARLG
jgi:hypothetical protein